MPPPVSLNIEPEHLTGILHKSGSIIGTLSGKTKSLTGIVMKNASTPYYDGPYVVDPSAHSDIILQTSGYVMGDDVTVNKIYYAEVSNLANGMTAYIADH